MPKRIKDEIIRLLSFLQVFVMEASWDMERMRRL